MADARLVAVGAFGSPLDRRSGLALVEKCRDALGKVFHATLLLYKHLLN